MAISRSMINSNATLTEAASLSVAWAHRVGTKSTSPVGAGSVVMAAKTARAGSRDVARAPARCSHSIGCGIELLAARRSHSSGWSSEKKACAGLTVEHGDVLLSWPAEADSEATASFREAQAALCGHTEP